MPLANGHVILLLFLRCPRRGQTRRFCARFDPAGGAIEPELADHRKTRRYISGIEGERRREDLSFVQFISLYQTLICIAQGRLSYREYLSFDIVQFIKE